jgi:hypothetical protein
MLLFKVVYRTPFPSVPDSALEMFLRSALNPHGNDLLAITLHLLLSARSEWSGLLRSLLSREACAAIQKDAAQL